MSEANHYDAVIIGSGQGGGPLARAFADAGKRTALIEREHVGGTCINEGCTPTKTMVASGRVAYLARRGADYGVRTGDISVDMVKVRDRKRTIVEEFRSAGQKRLESGGVDLLFGEARFRDRRMIEMRPRQSGGASQQLTAATIVINTGARPAPPPIDGLDQIPTLNSTTIMELDTVPEHLLVIGGSYVAVEFGQMFRRFGSRVTMIQREPQLFGREDPDIAEAVAGILEEDGIEVLLNTQTVRAESAGGNGKLRLTVKGRDGERTLDGSHVLVAAGGAPNSEALDLAAAGVEADERGNVRVNDRLETNVPGIYAIGDVKGGPAFTHISYDDYRILRTNLLGKGGASTNNRLVPYTVFMDPQLGRVGLSETEARNQGRSFRVASIGMNHVARALEVAESRGLMKVLVDDGDQILGAAILGIEGGELMSMLEIAMMGHLPYTALRDAIFAHPTLAESFNNLFATLDS